MILRMVEYDFSIGHEYAEKIDGRYQIRFPHSCILYLRGRSAKNSLEMDLIMPDGRRIPYRVPVIRMENYTKDALFQKHLLFLLPFYIIRYEKKTQQLEEDRDSLRDLLAEYREIERHLEEELLEKNKEKSYRDLIELIRRIADYIFRDSQNIRKGLGEVMGGKVLELESDRLIARGEQKERETGIRILVESGQEDGISKEKLQKRLEEKYRLDSGQALDFIRKYWRS